MNKSISMKLIFSIWLAISVLIIMFSIYDYKKQENELKER